MNSKTRAFLRGLAHDKSPEIHIGKSGLTDNLVQEMHDLLRTRELVKAQVLRSCEDNVKVVAESLAEKTEADVIGVIGKRFILYRFSEERAREGKSIELPRH